MIAASAASSLVLFLTGFGELDAVETTLSVRKARADSVSTPEASEASETATSATSETVPSSGSDAAPPAEEPEQRWFTLEGPRLPPVLRLVAPSDPPYLVGYQYSFPSSFQANTQRSASYHELDARLLLPIYHSRDLLVSSNFGYHLDSIHLDRRDLGDTDDLLLHDLRFGVAVTTMLRDDWALTTRIGVVMAGDFVQVRGDTFQPNGQLLASWGRGNHALTYGIGVSRQFFATSPFPLFGYFYRPPTGMFAFDLLVPAFARAFIRVHERFSIAPYVRYEGRVFDSESIGNFEDRYLLKRADLKVGAGLRIKLTDTLRFDVAGGITPLLRWELLEDANAEVVGLAGNPAPYVMARVYTSGAPF